MILPQMITDETQLPNGAQDYSLLPITQQLMVAAFEVHNILGYGFLERVYQNALRVELRGAGIKLGYLINFGQERVEYKRMVV